MNAKELDKGQLDALTAVLANVDEQPALPGLVDAPADDFDVLAKAAENLNAKRRARGRPEGSANKRNAEVFDYLEARGFKAPELRLMEVISADPRELAAALAGPNTHSEHVAFDKVLDVLRVQIQAARELMPYKFAKRQELQVNHQGAVAHVMMAGRLSDGRTGQADAFSLTGETVEYQEVSNLPADQVAQQKV